MIEKVKVTAGVYWIGVHRAKVFVLCGCPADSVKHLAKMGLVKIMEKDGVSFETGPNAILLSDILVQQGHFSNLSEFPVLQMLYKQGMILPKHPNNTGIKPILIGAEKQIQAQMQYIYCGNYGLTSLEEIRQTGVSEKNAQEMMRLKLKFAFGKIQKSEDLLDSRILGNDPVEIRNGVFVRRTGLNRFEFQYQGETSEVDLNLGPDEEYIPPYDLGSCQARLEYFSVIHTGEGDGWDFNRPCMASILVFQGRIYLIDAGPSILHGLMSLGINVNEIEGIFITHAHDDHFCGLTTLLRADHRIKFFTTPLVRASVAKKLAALMAWEEDHLDRYFEIHDLEFDIWNNIEGLEIKPTLSPHPVETNIYTFRALWEEGYRTYAHLADIVSFDVLRGMIVEDPSQPGISQEFFDRVTSEYLLPANLKKIDVGGGMIHGNAEDFRKDESEKIILSHMSTKLSSRHKEIGSGAPFGMMDVLIHTSQDYCMRNASLLLRNYFPDVPQEELRILLNCPLVSFNAGSIILKEGSVNPHIYLILTGIVELIQSKTGTQNILSPGYMVGEMSGIMQIPSLETYCAGSYIRALKIPGSLYYNFVERNQIQRNLEQILDNRYFLQGTWLFGEMISTPILNTIAQAMSLKIYSEGENIQFLGKPELLILSQGKLQARAKGQVIETLKKGDFMGEEAMLNHEPRIFDVMATQKSQVYRIPGDVLTGIPVVQWKLLEILEKRLKISRAHEI
jgi:hemerythrin